MSTPSTDGLKLEIDAGRMRTGNEIQLSSGLPAFTGVTQLTADATSRLQGTAHLPVVQPTITSQVFDLTGKSTSGVLSTTLVSGADVTTVTKQAFLRVNLTDSNGNITAGSYYIQLSTIT